MEAPKCKICGNRHYGLCRQLAPYEAAPRPARQQAIREEQQTQREGYNAFMREYMRKWRAKRKSVPN